MKKLINKSITFAFLPLLILLASNSLVNAQIKDETARVYIKIEIKGLACSYCAFGMEKELKKVSGVKEVYIELKKGLAYISTPMDQKPSKEDLTKIITDAGFTAGTIEYSDKQFNKEKKE